MTHTPGPWMINDTIHNQLYVEAQAGGFVCDLQLDEVESGRGQVLADAHLIATAPELLAALKELGRTTAPFISMAIASRNPTVLAAVDAANRALAKAEGNVLASTN